MFLALLSALTLVGQTSDQALPLLSPVFGDHMVLQRDRPNVFWGWTSPGTKVNVSVAGHTGSGIADATGKWTAKFTPPAVGGPYTVTIDGPAKLELKDVLVGDVWICSGQSNMEMGIGNVNNAQAEIAAANHPGIRLFLVPHAIVFDPAKTVQAQWAICTPDNVAAGGWSGFSAAAYFFGRELNQRLHVPIGLVQTCFGGTIAEAWTSKEGLTPLGDFDNALKTVEAQKTTKVTPYSELLADWYVKADAGSAGGFEKSDLDDSGWSTSTMPTSYDMIGLSDFDGVVWFRREITLPDTLPSGDATLELGPIDDADTTWVNGVHVGDTFAYDADRKYKVPAGLLKPGRNVIAIRVLDTGGAGAFTKPTQPLYLELGDQQRIDLTGPWHYKQGADLNKPIPAPQNISGNANVVTVLYNGMIAPLQPLAIKGAIWYQGESNGERGYQYRRLMPALIADWRKKWGEGDFPFLIVQLANYTPRALQPGDNDWAELREAQTMTAQHVHNVGLALAIDIGDAGDIHPKDKQDIGLRLALAGLHVAYGQNLPYSGPVYRSFTKEGSSIKIRFDHTEGGLKIKGDKLLGFAVAGADRKFHWADAEIQGNTVIVHAADVPDPVAVRYAWAINPDAPLYNGADLPAVPFRTDDWPGLSINKK